MINCQYVPGVAQGALVAFCVVVVLLLVLAFGLVLAVVVLVGLVLAGAVLVVVAPAVAARVSVGRRSGAGLVKGAETRERKRRSLIIHHP